MNTKPVSDAEVKNLLAANELPPNGERFAMMRKAIESFVASRAPVAQPADKALLQQALDALDYHVCQTRPIEKSSIAMAALHAALAQPVQPVTPLVAQAEPVAWRHKTVPNGLSWSYSSYDPNKMGWSRVLNVWEPLYTHPSKDADSRNGEKQHHAALQRIGCALGLTAGANLHTECVPEIQKLLSRQDPQAYPGKTVEETRQIYLINGAVDESRAICAYESTGGNLWNHLSHEKRDYWRNIALHVMYANPKNQLGA